MTEERDRNEEPIICIGDDCEICQGETWEQVVTCCGMIPQTLHYSWGENYGCTKCGAVQATVSFSKETIQEEE